MTATLSLPEGLRFTLPEGLEASEPPEERGLARYEVRLLVADETLTDRTFLDLPEILEPGDLLVVNTSATLPAAIPADGGNLLVHLGTQLPGGLWLVELRLPAGAGSLSYFNGRSGQHLTLPDGGTAHLLAPYPIATQAPARLWYAALHVEEDLHLYLGRHGHPIRYGYARQAWPLAAYQTVYADEPGSAEMPSAGRPFSARVLDSLARRGIAIARLVLHTGVSSQEENEPPYPEPYRVPAATADDVNAARHSGRRVIAVGTTVARALESVADETGRAHPGAGWTDLVITPQRGVRVISGILSGWHPPGASHLALLEAIAGPDLLARSYHHALSEGYRWHEFGDLHLVLP
ncbi:MAG: S-adenosylmethionine:tRNA ribosyltransferase-isomerase [Egibacteraceae bacterium]